MCGILGIIDLADKVSKFDFKLALNSMSHRGPDSEGILELKIQEQKIMLGHRRLSILDLHDRANQPMSDNKAHIHMVFNGEIYNHRELRDELEGFGYNFSTTSDTEVIIKGFIHWGTDLINRLDGMFAVGLVDKENSKLYLMRDYFAEKPLYYSINDGQIIFSSQLDTVKILKKDCTLSKTELAYYESHGYSKVNKTILDGVYQVSPGSVLEVDLRNGAICTHKINKSFRSVGQSHSGIIENVVSSRLMSDVPVGVLLSGGIDSSVIAYYANKRSNKLINFTVDFGDNQREIEMAKNISEVTCSKHVIIQLKEFSLEDLDGILSAMSDPVSDLSAIPTYLICKEIKKYGIKVVLGGDGGDEIYGGYSYYYRSWKSLVSVKFSKVFYNLFYDYLPFKYRRFLYNQLRASLGVIPLPRALKLDISNDFDVAFTGNTKELRYHDIANFLPSFVLRKNDQISMYLGLEFRAPFLSLDLLSFVEKNNLYGENKIKLLHLLQELNIAYKKIPKRGFSFSKIAGNIELVLKDYMRREEMQQIANEDLQGMWHRIQLNNLKKKYAS